MTLESGLMRLPDRKWESAFAFVSAPTLALSFAVIVTVAAGKEWGILALPVLIALIASITSVAWSSLFLVLSLFVDVHISAFTPGVWFSLVFGTSFLLKLKNFQWREFSSPLTIPLIIYGLCILPSFAATTVPWISTYSLFNVAAFLIVMYTILVGFRTLDNVRNLAGMYLGLVLVNSLDVIRLSWLGDKRPFGFSGVMFVDYVALGLCVSASATLCARGSSRRLLTALTFILAVALVLTQTRNTWLSAFFTIAFLAGYVIRHPDIVGTTRKKLVGMAVGGALILVLGSTSAVLLNPRVEGRVAGFADRSQSGVIDAGPAGKSLISRLFIWDTAINTFRANPIFGVGVYSFAHISHKYYTFPREFYDLYVKGNSPHQTYLAVLAETGIVGFIGYLVLMVTALTCAFRGIRTATETRGRHFAFIAAVAIVYCTVSMVFSDAWLWGQGIVLFGIVLGSMLAIRRINMEGASIIGNPEFVR